MLRDAQVENPGEKGSAGATRPENHGNLPARPPNMFSPHSCPERSRGGEQALSRLRDSLGGKEHKILAVKASSRGIEPPAELHMKNARNVSKALAAAALLLATACSGGVGGGGGGSLYIESCSLGCGDGAGGAQVACSVDLVGINPEFVVLFSNEVDLQTVDNQSFRVQNAHDGSIPAFD